VRLVCCLLAAILSHSSSALEKDTNSSRRTDDGLALSQPLRLAWRYNTDRTTDLTPAADAESVFFPLSNGVLLALNTSDGKLQWKAEVGGDFSAALVADERSVFAATGYTTPEEKNLRGTLRAL